VTGENVEFDRDAIRTEVAALAGKGVYIGTSSWKYPGWFGQIYTSEKYLYRGKVANNRFEANCLAEYAEVFKTVCVDAAYYTFPSEKYLASLASQVPDGFKFAFKVTDAITIKEFPNLPRFGVRAGQSNPDFLNADLFSTAFIRPLKSIREKVGIVMFEFSRFKPYEYTHGVEFVADLDRFLGNLPPTFDYGVEMRNRKWLQPEYFSCLARHRVTHVYNAWAAMPPVEEQMTLPGSVTNPEIVAARFLLSPGRSYAKAVETFRPYNKTVEINENARSAALGLVEGSLKESRKGTYIYVNNRLEGNAINTIAAIVAGKFGSQASLAAV
jgi:uncharacterized protein YecE (DUF72 family)